MTAGNFGPGWPTDADRTGAYDVLQAAYASGRLDQAEFDRRTAAVSAAQTRDQLAPLTADLPGRGFQAGPGYPGPGYPGPGYPGPGYPGQPAGYQGMQLSQSGPQGTDLPGSELASRGISGILLAILLGPAYLTRVRRGRYASPRLYVAMAFRLIIIGIMIYLAITHHAWMPGSGGGD